MPLVQCAECKTEVSDQAFKCPKCGFQLRKPKRSAFGKLIKWAFIGFNLLMLVWLIGGVGGAAQDINKLSNEAQKTGATIGTGLGAMMILFIWIVGAVILGLFVLFTRPKSE